MTLPDPCSGAGGPALEEELCNRLARRVPLAALFIHIKHLGAFNEEYGWERGEELVRLLGQTLRALCAADDSRDYLAHLFGDRYVILTTPVRAEAVAQAIVKRFDLAVVRACSDRDRERRYLDGLDRRGNPYRVSLPAVAIAIVSNEHRLLEHYLQVEELGAQVSEFVEAWPGSNYAFDCRRR